MSRIGLEECPLPKGRLSTRNLLVFNVIDLNLGHSFNEHIGKYIVLRVRTTFF